MIILTLSAALFSLALTLGTLWANPRRFSNHAFALVTLVQTAWLACLYRIQQIDMTLNANTAEWETWIRANAAVVSIAPGAIWLLTNAIVSNDDRRKAVISAVPFFALSPLLIFLCYADTFFSIDSAGVLRRGPAYFAHSFLGLTAYGSCIVKICAQMRQHCGIRRVELQFLALNTGGTAFIIGSLVAIGNYYNVRELNRLTVLFAFITSALTAWALLFHRVFNVDEVLRKLARRTIFILLTSAGVYGLWKATGSLIAEPFGLLISIAFWGPIAVWADRRSSSWFDGGAGRKLAQARQSAIALSRRELPTDQLIVELEGLLCSEMHTRAAYLLSDNGEAFETRTVTISRGRLAYKSLCELGWATPETLLRRRSSPSLVDLQRLLEGNDLGVVVCVPPNSPSPTLIIALSTRADNWPFTYPEVERLQNLALLIDNLVSRSRLAAQTALKAKMEHVAMMSRGLAHDLKNLLTPISSFLIHMDGRFAPDSAESEVHTTARQSLRVMTDYLREALFFSERLEPRFEKVNMLKLCQSSQAVMMSRAHSRQVRLVVNSSEDYIIADHVLLQRMLGNLLSNAIDASPAHESVLLTAKVRRSGWARFEVCDQGCGIAPENLERVFDPYYTTKEFGHDVRGFGLGLTIVQKIALLHGGAISVKSHPGTGSTFTVDLPLKQGMGST